MDKQILRKLQYTPQARDAMAATGPPDTLVGVSRSSSPQGIDESSPSLRRRHLTKRPSQRRRRRSSGLTGASADSFRCGALLHLGCICASSPTHTSAVFMTASRTSSPMHHLPVAIIVSSAGHSAALEPLAGTTTKQSVAGAAPAACSWDAAGMRVCFGAAADHSVAATASAAGITTHKLPTEGVAEDAQVRWRGDVRRQYWQMVDSPRPLCCAAS